MGPGPVVVVDVLRQDPQQMPFADHHDIVKAFPSNRSNHALGIGVLPGRTWRNDRFPEVQRPGLTRKSFSIDLASVPDQMPWGLLQPARLDQLSRSPIRGRMFRDIEMHQRRRSWLSTTSTNRTRNVAVGTVKKSNAIRSLA